MNTTKVTKSNGEKSEKSFSALLEKVIPRQNGTPAGVNALAESLKRGNAYLNAQEKLNDLCLTQSTQVLTNTLKCI